MTRPAKKTRANCPLTSERILEIVGWLGPERVQEIINTGASERELVEAKILAQQQDATYTEKSGVRTAVVHRLYDILRADLVDPHEL